jgi:uncharacterized protein
METALRSQWCQSVDEVSREAWDALAQPLPTPFFEWDWLHALEKSGSIAAPQGWQPCHLAVWRGSELIAVAPLYLKGHSYGEFVFDHQFADLAYRMGLEYYPKLLGMSPVTPAIGYRFLIAPDENEAALTELMLAEIDRFCLRNKILSCNFLYVDEAWRPLAEAAGLTIWQHHNSVWQNHGFQAFEDYLAMFNANQRRNIKREVKAMEKFGLTLEAFTGDGIPSSFFLKMYRFYSDHCDKFGGWGSKYLNKHFFEQLQHCWRQRTLFVAAFIGEDRQHPVAMSFCMYKGENLYGRYWGCEREIENLHFNACYYKPIEWSIAQGIQCFDPGAGGSHKKRRGFPATPHYSLHRWYNRRLGDIIHPYLTRVNLLEAEEIEAINNELPFQRPEITL